MKVDGISRNTFAQIQNGPEDTQLSKASVLGGWHWESVLVDALKPQQSDE